jgi:hypothetical protein
MTFSNSCFTQRRKDATLLFFAPLRLCVLFFFVSPSSYAQDSTSTIAPDSSVIVEKNAQQGYAPDTVLIKSYAKRFNPQKALLYAAILPGAGQVYTKKYWKVPLVYGGFIFLGYYVDFYNDGYRRYRGELFTVINGGVSASGISEPQLRTLVDNYRRERDLFIVFTGLFYMLQIIDAHVDTHLKEFDLNPNLQVRIEPSFKQDMILGRQSGFSISLRF